MPRKKILRGSTPETAIIIRASCSEEGIPMENEHLSRIFGAGWEKTLQCLMTSGNRRFDRVTIEVGRRSETIYFDITSFFPVDDAEVAARMPPGK